VESNPKGFALGIVKEQVQVGEGKGIKNHEVGLLSGMFCNIICNLDSTVAFSSRNRFSRSEKLDCRLPLQAAIQ
jgi:hypothetical protein